MMTVRGGGATERERERSKGIRCFELSVNFDGGGSAKRSCKRDARAIARADHRQDHISIAPLIYTRDSRPRDARLQLTDRTVVRLPR